MMKSVIGKFLFCFVICIHMSTVYGAENTYITEKEFIAQLNKVSPVEVEATNEMNIPLTREKAAVLLVEALGYEALADDMSEQNQFTDVVSSKGEMTLVSQLGLMNGVGNNQFAPNLNVTQEVAQNIVQKIQAKQNTVSNWKHACYAISSSSQLDWIKDYDAVSFGWAQVVNEEGSFKVVMDKESLKVPSGFEVPIDLAKENGVETYLMIYFDGQKGAAKSLLSDSKQCQTLIEQIVNMANGITKEDVTRSFDGITIDFEGLADSSFKPLYVNFLKQLRAALSMKNKKLVVAVQPTLYYKGYDYTGIGEVADYVILMAHDYGAKNLTEVEQMTGMTRTPLTPIDDVYLVLLEAKKAIKDTSKIALQFSFASLQWQKQNGTVLNQTAYTPSYDKINARLQNANTIVQFDAYYQSTYATYEENGISNTIWYEDTKSIQAKMDLAKLLGINSFSYWRLGMIPAEIKGLE